MSSNPSGWYQDPSGKPQQRWWNGTDWTDFVSVNGQTFVDAPTSAPAAPAAPVAPVAPAAPVPQAAPMAYAPAPASIPQAAVGSAGRRSLTQRLAAIAAVSLVVGGVVGYVAHGDNGGGGGGAAAGTLSTPILQGLSSLDSYEWKVSTVSVGPGAADRSEENGNGASDSQANLRYQKMASNSTSADDPAGSQSVTETWRTADMTCTFDGEEYTSDAANPFVSDMGTVLAGVFDIVIPQGNAKNVGSETIAGVAADHYTFTIQGLGAESGAQVEANSGEVWVAKDGGYLLKYQVTASLRSDAASSEVSSLTLTLELTSVNQPVNIQVPAACPAPTTVTT